MGYCDLVVRFSLKSRQTIYTIADSILYPLRHPLLDDEPPLLAEDDSLPSNSQSKPLTPDYKVERAILKMAFPGSVSIRAMQEILTETLGISRSIGFISQLLTRSGELAGQFLSELDYEHLDGIIALRDET